jgi:hypothetical protein
MAGRDQMLAEVGDVGFGTSPRWVNTLKVQGQVHDFRSPAIDWTFFESAIIVLSLAERAYLERFLRRPRQV